MNDIMIKQDKKLPHFELTGSILNCCFEVMEELGPGFLENVYKNALLIAMNRKVFVVENWTGKDCKRIKNVLLI